MPELEKYLGGAKMSCRIYRYNVKWNKIGLSYINDQQDATV